MMVFLIIFLPVMFVLGILFGMTMRDEKSFHDVDLNSIHNNKLGYDVFEQISQDKRFPMRKIAGGIKYADAYRMLKKKPDIRIIRETKE